MSIEELAFENRKTLANLNAVDLLDIIEFLQEDRNQWINQFTKTHNEGVDIQKQNKQLKDNWNNLKKWLEKELGDRINPNKDKWLTGVYDAYRETIDKMQELEQGSDSNE